MSSRLPRPLRLLHTSDWHIGQEFHGHDRQEEHDAFLAWLLDHLGTLEVNALVVTGDIFDVANPPVSATARFYGFLRDALVSQGLQVESLLIDEGFGTLDSASLGQAIGVLEQLHATGRRVGVISHIEDVKERIAVKIAVTPASNGSSAIEVQG